MAEQFAPEIAPSPSGPEDGKARLLVLDDETAISRQLAAFLDDYDEFMVRVAASAEEALEELAAVPADLCLVDMRLPGMGGKEFILLAATRGLCPRFIVHTGSVDFILPQTLLDLGLTYDDVFFKPADLPTLLRHMRGALHAKGIHSPQAPGLIP